MLLEHQPAHVSEEELTNPGWAKVNRIYPLAKSNEIAKKCSVETYTAVSIVRIGIGVGEFVVHSMITTPGHQIILTRNYMANDEEDTQRKFGLVAVE